MLINGEKWACDACIRGHRVSSCQHTDRPLSHIKKKGRPVSQCPHCRQARKSRTSHVKCQCGEKPHTKLQCPKDAVDSLASQKKQCCCGHGAKCTCCPKKDPAAPGPSAPRRARALSQRRPQPTHTLSEPTVTRPSARHRHRHSDASSCGQPYTIPTLRSKTTDGSMGRAQLSADHLAFSEAPKSAGLAPFQDSLTDLARPVRLVRSEQGSPVSGLSRNLPATLPPNLPLDLSLPPYDQSLFAPMLSYEYQSPSPAQDSLFGHEIETVASPAAINPQTVDLPTFDLSHYPNAFTTNYDHSPSFGSYDFANLGNPGMTLSSGDVSEVEDFPALHELNVTQPEQQQQQQHDAVSVSDGSETDMYRLSSSSSFLSLHHAQMLASNSLESIGLESFLKPDEQVPQQPQQPQQPLRLSMPIVINGYPTPQAYHDFTHHLSSSGSEVNSPLPPHATVVTTASPANIWSSAYPPPSCSPLIMQPVAHPHQW
ncbi:hypothetical protein AJ80_05994 [Polytolypa hystricis UAMH7299]|uniref:Copper-fist domain-containing protein n=1 Tax=Polytolypa hystricis (strain UAMH7299) TaxID=1447883 RepID=A0A2B7XR59_POLH7|nr:hypothetical protein AJ80_05994 [Polytolypa hystricis UAMH7299]